MPGRGERLGDHAALQHATPIETVGDVSGDEHQQERRQELREADEAEVERATGQRVDLPAHAHREHLVRDHRGDAREPDTARTRVARAAKRLPVGRPARVLDLQRPLRLAFGSHRHARRRRRPLGRPRTYCRRGAFALEPAKRAALAFGRVDPRRGNASRLPLRQRNATRSLEVHACGSRRVMAATRRSASARCGVVAAAATVERTIARRDRSRSATPNSRDIRHTLAPIGSAASMTTAASLERRQREQQRQRVDGQRMERPA